LILRNIGYLLSGNSLIGVNWAKNYTLFLGDDRDTKCHSGGFNTTRMTGFEHFEERNFMIRAVLRKSVVVDVKAAPKQLNLKSRGKWITVCINLPGDLDSAKPALASIMLNGTIPVGILQRYNCKTTAWEIMVKFRRYAIKETIIQSPLKIKVKFVLTGYFSNGIVFYGEFLLEVKN